MHIMTIKDYASLLVPSEVEDDDAKVNQYGCVTSKSDENLFVVQTDDSHFSLLPGPEFSPRLYRGQTKFYDNCVPSLFRSVTPIKYLVNLLKKYEFIKLMGSHPIIRDLANWSIDGKYFKIDMDGLSQHYEFATAMVDVTRSKDIAMFFALCVKNEKTDRYEPIRDESREAVLYTIDMKALLESNSSDFHVVGFQPLPRPDVQKAYSIPVGWMENFNSYPYVSYEVFRVNRNESERYLDMFAGGEKLFPNDAVDSRAVEIRRSMEIDREVLEVCFERHLIPKVWASISELIAFLDRFGYVVTDKNLAFSNEEKKEIIARWNNKLQRYRDRVKCRFSAPSL